MCLWWLRTFGWTFVWSSTAVCAECPHISSPIQSKYLVISSEKQTPCRPQDSSVSSSSALCHQDTSQLQHFIHNIWDIAIRQNMLINDFNIDPFTELGVRVCIDWRKYPKLYLDLSNVQSKELPILNTNPSSYFIINIYFQLFSLLNMWDLIIIRRKQMLNTQQ